MNLIIIILMKKIKVWSSTNPGGRKTKKPSCKLVLIILLYDGCPSYHPNNTVKALKEQK